jgi:hypothetical protein
MGRSLCSPTRTSHGIAQAAITPTTTASQPKSEPIVALQGSGARAREREPGPDGPAVHTPITATGNQINA